MNIESEFKTVPINTGGTVLPETGGEAAGNSKEHIVMIEDFFHPTAGYQVNVLSPYLIRAGYRVSILCGELDRFPDYLTAFFGKNDIGEKDERYTAENGIEVIRVKVKKYVSGRAIYGKEIFNIVKQLRPDILYVHGNDTYVGMQFLSHQKKVNCPIISDTHMLELASTNPLAKLFRLYYRFFVTPHIINNHNMIIRTVDDPFIMKWYGIPKEQAPLIGFGSDTLRFHPDAYTRKAMREKYGYAEEDIIIVYAGKLDESKGGYFLAEAIKERITVQGKQLKFLIIGNVSGDRKKETETLLYESENPVLRQPTQPYPDLPKWFQMSDVAVFPKQCSLSYYDVLACGLPVLVEDNPIGLQRANECKATFTFKSANVDDFRLKIVDIANIINSQNYTNEEKKLGNIALHYILDNYNYEKQAKKYEGIIKVVAENYNK